MSTINFTTLSPLLFLKRKFGNTYFCIISWEALWKHIQHLKKKKKDPLEQAKLQRQNKFSFFRKKGFWKDAMIFEEKKKVWREKEEYFLGWKDF